jgi:hypothetical protein
MNLSQQAAFYNWQRALFVRFLVNARDVHGQYLFKTQTRNCICGNNCDLKLNKCPIATAAIESLLDIFVDYCIIYQRLLRVGKVEVNTFPPLIHVYNRICKLHPHFSPITGKLVEKENEILCTSPFKYIRTLCRIDDYFEQQLTETRQEKKHFIKSAMKAFQKMYEEQPAEMYVKAYQLYQQNRIQMAKLSGVLLLTLAAMLAHTVGLQSLALVLLALAAWCAYNFQSFLTNVIFGVSWVQVKGSEAWNWIIGEDMDDDDEFGEMSDPPPFVPKTHTD